jgi:hypothetical protein
MSREFWELRIADFELRIADWQTTDSGRSTTDKPTMDDGPCRSTNNRTRNRNQHSHPKLAKPAKTEIKRCLTRLSSELVLMRFSGASSHKISVVICVIRIEEVIGRVHPG